MIARSPVSRFHSLITGSALALLYILRLQCPGLSRPWTTVQLVTTDTTEALSPLSHHGQCRDVLPSMVWKGTGLTLRAQGPPRMKHRLCLGLNLPNTIASSKLKAFAAQPLFGMSISSPSDQPLVCGEDCIDSSTMPHEGT